MGIEFFAGKTLVYGMPQVALNQYGHVYMAAVLGARWPKEAGYARLGYDRADKVLVLRPQVEPVPGAAKMTLDNGSARRCNAKVALMEWGLLPASRTVYTAAWRDGMIQVQLETAQPLGESGRKGPAPRPDTSVPHAARRRDAAKAKAMDRAIEHEDALPGPPASSLPCTASDLLTAQQIVAEFGISQGMLWQVCSKGDFPKSAGKQGKRYLYRRAEVAAWFARRQKPAPAPEPPARPQPPADEGLIGMVEVCRLVGCSPTSITYYRRTKAFPAEAKRIGHKFLYRRAEIEAWVKARQKPRAKATAPAADGAKTCATCADNIRVGKRSICRSQSGPKRNTAVTSTGTCEFHRKPSAYRPRVWGDEDD
jgi:predicted DNA-binding transcriptional regulator AlpA